ncbi:acyl CoA:acetate/3-ketoacid CoA transferase [Beggiatoa leptomitoformis]|uniref:Acetate CoA-transferase YdiF n=1 Tax=Beggiatoa leptomitoformis TaxID=288004 RepID=A0A2N9YD38_9GAMM|nr:CoA-transferase [Beggiatoa leptomitoformis]ALG69220.1 acyl CoA:acetate/3-ketoacid CoA transferase [Beggiatoa leptomitoformis]AUI68344.1 acyl CoA:acetate/3-ketoacid CoA transferase [Beggiatoa leptomitoformis]
MRNKIVTAIEAVKLIKDGDTLATGGFVGTGFAEELAITLEKRFLETGEPNHLTLVYAAGQGDGQSRGLNHLGYEGLIKRVIGGHWGLVPALGILARQNRIEAYNLPQGVIAHLYRDIAAHKPGTITHVGLHTFVDPRIEGGKINSKTTENIVELLVLSGKEYLFYKAFPINVAFLRGTTADELGNITMEHEALVLESLAIAQAVKNSGGIVIVQVKRVTARHMLNPQMIQIPCILVDYIVIAQPENHPQTFSEYYNSNYTGETHTVSGGLPILPLDARKVMARRATLELQSEAVVNLGIGTPEGIASIAYEEAILDSFTLTIEPGGIGGIPAGGLSFGAVADAYAIIDQPAQFDFYDGGGLDQAFLGMAQADKHGNVNVSRFASRMTGAGGFINISQNAKQVYFMGTFTSSDQEFFIEEGRVQIFCEGTQRKFVDHVQHLTFNGQYALEKGQKVLYITERAVFRLTPEGMLLIEIAPGVDVDKDILANMDFKPLIAHDLCEMDKRLFKKIPMGLRHS